MQGACIKWRQIFKTPSSAKKTLSQKRLLLCTIKIQKETIRNVQRQILRNIVFLLVWIWNYFLLKMKTKQIKWSLLLIDTISHHKVTFFSYSRIIIIPYFMGWPARARQPSWQAVIIQQDFFCSFQDDHVTTVRVRSIVINRRVRKNNLIYIGKDQYQMLYLPI